MPAYALTQPVQAGLGFQDPLNIANPGANTNVVYPIDGRGLRRLVSLVFTLHTDANVANRYVTVEYVGGDGLAFSVNAAGVVVTAGTSAQRYAGTLGRGQAEWATGTDILFPLEALFLHPGDSLQILVANKQAGDTLTNIRGVLERYPLDYAALPTVED